MNRLDRDNFEVGFPRFLATLYRDTTSQNNAVRFCFPKFSFVILELFKSFKKKLIKLHFFN